MDHVSFVMITAAVLIVAFIYVQYRKELNRLPIQPSVDIHLDIETLGTRQDAPILSVAAVAFDQFGQNVGEYTSFVESSSANNYGVADPATVDWWGQQSEAARFEAFERGPRVEIPAMLDGLSEFFSSHIDRGVKADKIRVWGNAPSFDCVILRHAYYLCNKPCPWHFWQERCVRTIASIAKEQGYDAKLETEFKGEPHVALHDAKHQARYTKKALSSMHFTTTPWIVYLIKKFG